jgi:hypothetical protein
MTTDWFIFGVVMPATVAALGWIAVLLHERDLRRQAAAGVKLTLSAARPSAPIGPANLPRGSNPLSQTEKSP